MYTFWSLIKPLTMIVHSWSLIIHWHNLLLHGDVVSQAKFIPIVKTSDHHERIFFVAPYVTRFFLKQKLARQTEDNLKKNT